MQINTNTIVSVTEANQNFSRVSRIAEKNGQAVIFKNNRPKYMLIDLESNPMLELTDDEKIDIVAARILKRFKPAFEEGMALHKAEIDSIVASAEAPTFDNVILAYDNSGLMLSRVERVFDLLNSAHTSDKMQALSAEIMPLLSSHRDAIAMNDGLFAKVKSVYDNRKAMKLTSEQNRLTELLYESFVRSGALLAEDGKARLKEINDIYGHSHGDNALILFSDVLKACSGEDKIAVRYGGDEFLIIGPVADKEEAEDFKTTLETELKNANERANLPYQIEASIGYVLTDAKSKAELDDYVEEADELMYEVKKQNRKNRQSYSEK